MASGCWRHEPSKSLSSVVAPDSLPGPDARRKLWPQRAGHERFRSHEALSCPPALSAGAAYDTHFWVDPKEKIVGILMAQTPNQEIRGDFENAVMHALVGGSGLEGTN